MHLANLLFFAGAVAALAFPAPNGGKDDMCCCCDSSRLITVCNPDIPAKDCFCTLVMCPADAPTITESSPVPTPGPPAPPAPGPPANERSVEDTYAPRPPPGQEWCCCCDGKNNVCTAKPFGSECICILIACPPDAETIYPEKLELPEGVRRGLARSVTLTRLAVLATHLDTAAAASPANAEGGLPIPPRQDENPTLSKETGGEFEASASRLPHESVVSRKQQQQQQEEACFVDLEELTRGQSLALKDILKQHFDAYMEYMFYLPSLSFLHPASTYKAIEEGTLPPALGAAICAVVSPLLKPCPAGEDFGARCIDQVELHIWRSMHTFSDNTFILLALGLMYDFTTCSFAKAWQSIGVGLRLMLGLQANWEASPSRPSLSPAASPSELFIKQECRRRAVWFFFVFDRILAGGYDAYVSCQRENMKIGLPCDDQAFLEGQPKRAIRLDENLSKASGNIGIVGFAVLMMDLRHKIESYSRTLACDIAGKNSECDLPSTVMSDINDLQNSLSQLHTALPARLRLSQRSIATHMSLTEKNVFVWFHTHFFTAHIDLYRFALPGFHQKHQREILKRLPKDFIEKSQRQAVAHAIIMARFCEDIMEETRKLPARPTDSWQPRRLAGDMTITLMATQSLRVLLVALQYRLYEGLDLAEHSTVPLWRLGSATGPQIRQLVDSLIKISEPWAEVWHMSRYVHQQNVAMVEHFDKTHRFTDRRGTVSYTASTINQGSARLPGAHFMLDSFHLGDDAREQRKRAHEAAAQSWWARRGSHAHQSSGDEQDNGQANVPTEKGAMGDRCAIADREAELEAASIAASYAPPGVPMALAHARGDQFEMHDLNMLSMEHSFSAWQQATGVWPMLDLMALQQHSTPGLQSAAAQLALMPQQQSMSGEGPTAWPPVMPDPGPYFATPGQVVAAEGSHMFLGDKDQNEVPVAEAPFAWPGTL
ncbi:fungal specific transcription factor domain-containing protein [Sarocladium implicatum]|nr:fungal specific transcription factor domain-containing protein [Sarocladium implicatum]